MIIQHIDHLCMYYVFIMPLYRNEENMVKLVRQYFFLKLFCFRYHETDLLQERADESIFFLSFFFFLFFSSFSFSFSFSFSLRELFSLFFFFFFFFLTFFYLFNIFFQQVGMFVMILMILILK